MRFFIVDVFAEQKYAGNPLAVFQTDGASRSGDFQQIAAEINFSESTFVAPGQRNGGYDVRIFTPDGEIPFAGHPTLGTAYVIHSILKWESGSRLLLNLSAGQIPVAFNDDRLTMEQKQPQFGPEITERSRIASILKVSLDDLDHFPVQIVSTGLPCVIVPLKNKSAVERCSINRDLYRDFLQGVAQAPLLVFTREVADQRNDVHVRVFLDGSGFFEDPATGSANGNLAAYVVEHRYFGKATVSYRVEQGVEMRRPSLLHVDAEKTDGRFMIRVGGRVVPVAEGEWP